MFPDRGAFVELKKLRATDNPVVRTPCDDEYLPGGINPNYSIPTEYTIKGYVIGDIVTDMPLVIERVERNGVVRPGIMTTSVLQKIEHTEFGMQLTTLNSVYHLSFLQQKGDN